MCITSLPSLPAIIGLHSCRTKGPRQLLVPLLGRLISLLASILLGERPKPYLLKGEGVAECAKGIQNTNCSEGERLSHPPAREEMHAEQETPLHYLGAHNSYTFVLLFFEKKEKRCGLFQ